MNLISIENIAKSFGERVIFEQLSFGINKGQKIALIAKNGTGKTCILKIVGGTDLPDSGQVNYRKDLKIAYLEQQPDFPEALTVEETILASGHETLKVIAQYEHALQNMDDDQAYQKAFEKMEQLQAWDFENEYQQVLSLLKLEDLNQKVGKLSGGQKRRLALAIAILQKPDVMLLDEPTNHLDLDMIEWLEKFFEKENITLLMVSHDRYFLERVCNEIIELENGQLYSYKGNYSNYLEKKQARLDAEAAETGKARNLFVKELDWMRRQPKARTTKSKSRIDDFYEIKEKAQKRRKEHQMELEINMERMGNKIVEFHQVGLSYGDLPILKQFNYRFQPGERIGIIGKNGTGKTTFLNLVTQQMQPDNGKIVIGETIKFGYYQQRGIEVVPGQKVIEVIKKFGEFIPLKKGKQISAEQLLERFLFDRKQQYDYVEKLSGGEQKRLYLCTVLIQNPNFLILDEPTNDLDILTLNVLENFLLDYPGCLLVVSHDRYFMDKIVDHLFVFRGQAEVEDFPGNYSDYRAYEESKPPQDKKTEKAGEVKAKGQPAGLSSQEKKQVRDLENELEKLTSEKQRLEQKFTNTALSPEEITKISIQLNEVNQTIDEKEMLWLELTDKQ
ncbi:MAG: ABC-F family ATP-binding cassette domain-containing protein [Flavobacteriaceae bacterium]|nr:ABC-F family ATP-binding cassette domain-containing protein [Flavobacteriaceae bacterium]